MTFLYPLKSFVPFFSFGKRLLAGCFEMRLSFMYVSFMLISTSLHSQTKSLEFLNLPGNATLSAMGGVNVSSASQHVNVFLSNPAMAGDTTNGWGSASYLFYFADIGMANFSHQHNFKKVGALSFGVQHLGYGQIEGYDEVGVATGVYNSGETSLFIGKSHRVNHFRLGANLKGTFSNVAGYRASALLVDLGGVFIHPHQDLTFGLVIKNLGFLLSEYSETSTTELPFDIQGGVSFKPEHMPVRFSFTAHHLTSFDILYYNPADESEIPNTLDKVLAHFNLGAEVLIHKHVNFLLGYNFLRHQELRLENAGGSSGISVGALVRVRNMELSISRTSYVASGSYQVSLSVNIEKLVSRK
ncbi:MAG: type IX secretion system protein PorQ [Bacteroidia bacterium]|nr:type IX secretion system protein PorQ [Bacteroidia bacterium]